MNDKVIVNESLSAFEILADYERRGFAHVSGLQEKKPEPGTWLGIGFRVGGRNLVSEIDEIGEILSVGQVTYVPGTKAWLLGVSNVRGGLVPLIDLKGFLVGTLSAPTQASRVMIVRQQAGNVGLLVDEVAGLHGFAGEQRGVTVRQNDPFSPYVTGNYVLGGVVWERFSMEALVRNAEFLRAAA